MDVWKSASEIFIFGFSSVFLVLGILSITVVLTRVVVARLDARGTKKK